MSPVRMDQGSMFIACIEEHIGLSYRLLRNERPVLDAVFDGVSRRRLQREAGEMGSSAMSGGTPSTIARSRFPLLHRPR